MKFSLYLGLILLSTSSMMLPMGFLGARFKKIYETYYGTTKTTQEIKQALSQDLNTTYLGVLPADIRNEIVKYEATDELKKLFYRIAPFHIGVQVRVRITAPDHDYVSYLLLLGANPNAVIVARKTALDIISEMMEDIREHTQLSETEYFERYGDELYKRYKRLADLLRENGGKKFSDL